eukprot:3071502-Prymnesium_polylepis.1
MRASRSAVQPDEIVLAIAKDSLRAQDAGAGDVRWATVSQSLVHTARSNSTNPTSRSASLSPFASRCPCEQIKT